MCADAFDIIKTRRTIRQYKQRDIALDELREIVDAGRYAPSARNVQPLEYVVVDRDGPRQEMFKCMGFGGELDSLEGKEPVAYVVVLINKNIESNWYRHDSGMAVQNMMLAAWSKGIASCVLARINRERIRELLKIPDRYEIDLVVTMGYPAEKSVAEDMKEGKDGDTRYYRDDKGVLHVPKRRPDDVMHRNGF